MEELYLTSENGISEAQLREHIKAVAAQFPDARKVLLIPPDFTRCYSKAGDIARILYDEFSPRATVRIIPALGTHAPMSEDEKLKFFGPGIPEETFLIHSWQNDTVKLGVIPAEFVSQVSEGLYNYEIDIELNPIITSGEYDLIFSIGQVVPHEVAGMANYSKNLFVGLGGRSMINRSHMLGAICGIEEALGNMNSPARILYDYAQREYIDGKVPLVYIQTVTSKEGEDIKLHGVFSGPSRRPFELASEVARKANITHVGRRAKKVVTYLDPEELKSTWVGNKGIYRTRTLVADGGDLLILAPGVCDFGENPETDAMIRKYGYKGRDNTLKLYNEGIFENKEMSAAHLIHGSSDGRFTITYATKPENLSKEEIESVGFKWQDYSEAASRYDPEKMQEGWNTMPDGEEVYYIGTPALGLWLAD